MIPASAKIRKWYPAADVNALPLKEGRRIQWNEREVALFNLGDEYLAIDNRCPHQEGPLADGLVAGKNVFCPLHNWKISLQTGCALNGGKGQVKTYPVKVIKGTIFIALEEGIFQEASACEGNEQNAAASDRDI